MEQQALEAIYGDDYKKLDAGGFEVMLVPEAGAGEDVNHVSVALHVTYTPTYPEAAPELSLRPVRRGGLTDELVAECEALLREAASSEELAGTAMVYALGEKCVEWLVELGDPIAVGQPIARVHEPRRLGVEPADYCATIDGILAMRHHPGLVKMGDAIAMQAYLD